MRLVLVPIFVLVASCSTLEPQEIHVHHRYKKEKSGQIAYASKIIESMFKTTPKDKAYQMIEGHCGSSTYKVISTGTDTKLISGDLTMMYKLIEYKCLN